MQFLYPSFLFALFALAIPIIIHLFYFRRFKKVYFTNVKFLKEVKEETSSRNRLKNLLVLLMRLLAISFLVFAFAQPFIPLSEESYQGTNEVSIFVDNSFSMRSLSQDVALFDKAKDKAKLIIQAFSDEDKFQVLSHDLEARHQRLVSQEDAINYVDELDITPSVNELSKVIQFQDISFSQTRNKKHRFLISDFQRNISDIDDFVDTTIQSNLVVLQSVKEQNVSIDSAWFEAPVPMINQSNEMIVKISNYSETETENIQLNLFYENQNRPLGIVSIAPNSSTTDTFHINVRSPGWHDAKVQILDFPVQFDDEYNFSFRVKEKVRVLAINSLQPNSFLSAAFKGLNYFDIENKSVNQLSYGDFPNFDLIVLNDLNQISSGLAAALNQYVENGGNLLVFPGADIELDNFNDFCREIQINQVEEAFEGRKEVGSVNTEEFIFNNVFDKALQNIRLPVIEYSYKFGSIQNRPSEELLTFRDGSSFISKYTSESGHVYICASPLSVEFNDLVRNAEIFIPMLYKMAISMAKKEQIAYTIGKDNLIQTDNLQSGNESIYKISGPEEFIPGQLSIGSKIQLDIRDQIKQAGIYSLILDNQILAKLSFNYDRIESDLAYYSVDELKQMYGDYATIIDEKTSENLKAYIIEQNKGIQLWKWCIILVLIFLGLEVIILRFWKT